MWSRLISLQGIRAPVLGAAAGAWFFSTDHESRSAVLRAVGCCTTAFCESHSIVRTNKFDANVKLIQGQGLERALQHSLEMYDKPALYERTQLLEFCTFCTAAFPDDINLKWMKARAMYEVALKGGKADAHKMRDALQYIRKVADEGGKNHYAVQKWLGILLQAHASREGTKTKIKEAMNVKNHWMKACELNPNDATSRHLIGEWCYAIASIQWYEYRIAQVIYATPPTSTFEEALQHFLEAENSNPGFYKRTRVRIGECYLKLGDPSSAKDWMEKALEVPVKTNEDMEDDLSARAFLGIPVPDKPTKGY